MHGEPAKADFMSGGGSVGALMRAHDWSLSPLGSPEDWPQSMRSIVGLLLTSRFPMFLAWGPELGFLYNDAYTEILGAKHPTALGRPFQEIWSEIWPAIGPLVERALAGEATFSENLPLTIRRKGFDEQTWFTFSYSPVRNKKGDVAGLFCACTETTSEFVSRQALRESEARLRALTDNLPAGMVYQMVTGPGPADRRFLHVSASHERLTGIPAQVVLEDASAAYDLILPEYRLQVGEAEARAIEGTGLFDVEVPIRRTDGEIRWTRIISAPRKQGDGSLIWDGIQIDVTDQRNAVADLRASEARLRLAQEAAGIGVWEWDVTTGAITWSSEMYRILGLDPVTDAADPYRAWLSVLHPDDRVRSDETARHAAALGEAFSMDFRVVLPKSGETRWVRSHGTAVLGPDKRPLRFTGVNVDITDERERQALLAARNESLELAVSERTLERDRMWRLSTDVMLVAQFDGRIVAINPAWTALFGWAENELIGRSFLDLVHPDDLEATLAATGSLSRGVTIPRFENRYRAKDGTFRWLSWTAVPDVEFIHAVGRDVQAEKEAAENLARTEEALRQSQKMEAVGQLTGGVAHDFNNLLTVIRSSIDFLKRPNLPDDRRQRYVDAISDAVSRASKLTGQLLAFARRQALKPEVFDVRRSVENTVEMVGTLTGSRIRIETRLPDVAAFVHADPNQFDTSIVNMVVNARDAMNGEGVLTIGVGLASSVPSMRMHPARSGHFVYVTITDTGSGIEPGRIEQIFEPFFTTKEVGQGTGLGLSQVFGFAKQSGGEVGVESQLGKGTTFTLYLPRVGAPDTVGEEAEAPDVFMDGQGTCVLVVEDNVEVGTFATQALGELGYGTVWATDAEEALTELAKDAGRFHVVFSDVVMPGMNGVDLARQIRRMLPDLPVVLTSGYSHVLAQDGPSGFELLHKPYSVEQLSRVLRKAVTSLPRDHPPG